MDQMQTKNDAKNEITHIDGWGGNMEKIFVSDLLNTVRAAQPQVLFVPKNACKAYGLDAYNQEIDNELSMSVRSANGGDNTAKVIIQK